MSELPDKPSELIRLALADLRKCEADPRYLIDMAECYRPVTSELCYVCLAGAVMAKTLGQDIWVDSNPLSFERDIRDKFNALHFFMCGYVGLGIARMGLMDENIERLEFDRKITPYGSSVMRFHKDMANLTDDLEKAGL
jgi:hypothetical protein